MNTKIIVTVGPATNTETHINKIKEANVNFIRVNMSHSPLSEFEYFLNLSQKIGIPFIIDTEGSQIRTGDLDQNKYTFNQGDFIKIHHQPIIGNNTKINLKPHDVVPQLEIGDLIHIDFDTLAVKITDTSTINQGYIVGQVTTTGFAGKNKAVIIDSVNKKKIKRPVLSPKDYEAIKIGLDKKIKHIAVSFVRSGQDIDEVREATKNSMQIISKVECLEALENLDDIITKSDMILIDRGDLSKEISFEKIPAVQKVILQKARLKNKPAIVATNLLESMINQRRPTIAEVNDITSTILSGASGLTLAAETAIGKYPLECIDTLKPLSITLN